MKGWELIVMIGVAWGVCLMVGIPLVSQAANQTQTDNHVDVVPNVTWSLKTLQKNSSDDFCAYHAFGSKSDLVNETETECTYKIKNGG